MKQWLLKLLWSLIPIAKHRAEERIKKEREKIEREKLQKQDEREQIERLQRKAGEAAAAQSRHGDGTI